MDKKTVPCYFNYKYIMKRNAEMMAEYLAPGVYVKEFDSGVNLIRAIPGQGIRVWGARTCSSDGNWKYVNVRRLFIFLEESIRANTG